MGGRCRPQFLAEQTAQQGDQGNADQGDTTASHELLHTLTLCGGVITAVTFHEVHSTPQCRASAFRLEQIPQDVESSIKKFHSYISFALKK